MTAVELQGVTKRYRRYAGRRQFATLKSEGQSPKPTLSEANTSLQANANFSFMLHKFFDDSLWVNDDSRVIIENIIADNGTIHVVDNVILGPWPRVAEDAQ